MGWDHVKYLEDRIDRLEEKVSDITVKLEASSSIIKSIQRGTDSGDKTITINKVDPNKTIVLINGGRCADGSYSNYPLPRLIEMTETSIKINGSGQYNDGGYYKTAYFDYSWQVIEFW